MDVKNRNRRVSTRLGRPLGFALLATLGLALLAASPAAAQPAFEPNDNLLTATGPLGINQAYTAATETSNDKDFYYFYVTTPSSAQVTVTLRDLGGGPSSSGYTELELEDSHGYHTYSNTDLYAPRFNYDTFAVTLTAGKYYLEVSSSSSSYGDTYSISTAGTEGAFGEYAPIAAQCAAATASVAAVQGELGKAEAWLKRTSTRLQRTRNSRSRRARRRARAAYAKAKALVTGEKEALKAATKAQQPWCFIPQ
jgi:hypothetical protein